MDGPDGARLDPITGQLTWTLEELPCNSIEWCSPDGGIQLPHAPAQSVTSLTLEGWFRFAAGGNQVLIDKSFNWATAPFFTLRYFSGNLQLLIGNVHRPGLKHSR